MKIFLLLVAALLAGARGQVDQTLVPQASGSHVVEAVVSIIQEKCVFKDDKLFLRRLAYVGSNDGTAPGTFSAGNYGGIWQLDESKYQLTKTVSNTILGAVQTEYGINWSSTSWSDLHKPLYSGLAARLFLQYIRDIQGVAIPSAVSDQAGYWTNRYASNVDEATFVTLSNNMTNICDVVADVAFMLDHSGSVGPTNFQTVKNFVKAVTAQLNVGPDAVTNSRVSVTVFSNGVIPKFDFDDHSSINDYTNAINSITSNFGGTQTHLALNYLASNTFTLAKGARSSSVPKIAVVVTDGRSGSKAQTLIQAANLIASGVRVFAVGVGSNLDMQELSSIASDPDCTHLSLLQNFQEFDAFVNQIEKKVCDVETNLTITTDSEIKKNGIKYYIYIIKAPCDVLEISSRYGDANVYYSMSYQPNPARYEGIVKVTPTTPRFLFTDLEAGTVYITAEALSDVHLTFEMLKLNCTCPGCLVPVSLGPNFHQCISVNGIQSTTTPEPTVTTPESLETGVYDCDGQNPCSPQVIIPNKFYYPHTEYNMYVQCSEWGQCYEMTCPAGLQWKDEIHACDY